MSAWLLPADKMPPLHRQILVEMKEGVGTVCDVACYIGKQPGGGGRVEDRWILADVRLETRQIKRWAFIYPEPPADRIADLERRVRIAEEALQEIADYDGMHCGDADWDLQKIAEEALRQSGEKKS